MNVNVFLFLQMAAFGTWVTLTIYIVIEHLRSRRTLRDLESKWRADLASLQEFQKILNGRISRCETCYRHVVEPPMTTFEKLAKLNIRDPAKQ